jgi:hypothetical protein
MPSGFAAVDKVIKISLCMRMVFAYCTLEMPAAKSVTVRFTQLIAFPLLNVSGFVSAIGAHQDPPFRSCPDVGWPLGCQIFARSNSSPRLIERRNPDRVGV